MGEFGKLLRASPKIRIPSERLMETVESDTLFPNLLIEVSSIREFEDAVTQEKIDVEGFSLLDVFPNPIVKGSFTARQLLQLGKLDCVLSIEEDTELHIENMDEI